MKQIGITPGKKEEKRFPRVRQIGRRRKIPISQNIKIYGKPSAKENRVPGIKENKRKKTSGRLQKECFSFERRFSHLSFKLVPSRENQSRGAE